MAFLFRGLSRGAMSAVVPISAVGGVLASLYPMVPVIVGLVSLGERLRRSQAVGLAAALLATTLIAVA